MNCYICTKSPADMPGCVDPVSLCTYSGILQYNSVDPRDATSDSSLVSAVAGTACAILPFGLPFTVQVIQPTNATLIQSLNSSLDDEEEWSPDENYQPRGYEDSDGSDVSVDEYPQDEDYRGSSTFCGVCGTHVAPSARFLQRFEPAVMCTVCSAWRLPG